MTRLSALAVLLPLLLALPASAQRPLGPSADTVSVVWQEFVPAIVSLDASPDGTRLATGIDTEVFGPGAGQPIQLRFWDAATGNSLSSILSTGERPFRAPGQVDFLDDGASVFAIHNRISCIGQGGCSTSGRLRRWVTEGGPDSEPLSNLYFSRTGTALAAQGGFVTFGRSVSGTENFFVYERSGDVYNLVYSATENRVSEDAVFSPDTTTLVTTPDRFGNQVAVRTVGTWAPDQFLALEMSGSLPVVLRPAFSPDGSLLAVGVSSEINPGIYLFRTSDWAQVAFLDLEAGERGVRPVFTADGEHVVGLIDFGDAERLGIYRVADGTRVFTETLDSPPINRELNAIRRLADTNRFALAANDFLQVVEVNLDGGAGAAPVMPEIEWVSGPTGGSMRYAVTLTNTTSQPQTFTAEVRATLPNGSPYGPLEGPRTVTLAPSQAVGPRVFTREMPAAAPAGTYTVTLSLSSGGAAFASDSFTFTKGITEVEALAARAAVEGVYPNPFAATTTIRFALGEASEVRLTVYDVLGREVAVLADGAVEAGAHDAVFDGRSLPSGVYVWRLVAGDQTQTGRLTLVE